jgi:hypothetical protein
MQVAPIAQTMRLGIERDLLQRRRRLLECLRAHRRLLRQRELEFRTGPGPTEEK